MSDILPRRGDLDVQPFILKRDEDIAKACAILKELSQPGKTLDEMLAPFSPQVELKQP